MPTYEAMFLLDSGIATKDYDAAEAPVLKAFERYGATIRIKGPWDERKLAYPINHQRRGSYLLAYFDGDGEVVRKIRRDLGLTEEVLRCLILRVPDDVEVPETIEVPRAPHGEEERGRRDRGPERRGFRRYGGKARCRFSRWGVKYVDWKETQTLSRLCTGQGKMFSRKRSGNCARHQRQFKRAVKYARYMALMPYITR